MAVTLKEVAEAFEHLFETMHDPGFRKSIDLKVLKEHELLRYVRFFLLGWFRRDAVDAETEVSFPWTESGTGRVDFFVGDVAIELAVRNGNQPRSNLLDTVNAPEVIKLMKHDGLAMLVLFDFSLSPLTDEDLERFRDVPSPGQGNHKRTPFHVYYFNAKRGREAVSDDERESEFAPFHKLVLVPH